MAQSVGEKKFEAFVRGYLDKESFDLLGPWVEEVIHIALGRDAMYSAKLRGVTRDAVKAQRKKIFHRLQVRDGREFILRLLWYAVTSNK